MRLDNDITFFSKKAINCPICGKEIYVETLRSGGGRLNTDKITLELRTTYRPTEKFGEVFPLIYYCLICPHCYYAAFEKDFKVLKPMDITKLQQNSDDRVNTVSMLFPRLDFDQPRTLKEGIASYLASMISYSTRNADASPTIKQGICAIRIAWLLTDLSKKFEDENYDKLAVMFYRYAAFFYRQALELEAKGKEAFSNLSGLGPDLSPNYGFDGVLYLSGLLEFRYGDTSDMEKRKEILMKQKSSVARVFGMGKSNKNKPQDLLDRAREVYSDISSYLQSLDEDYDEDEEDDENINDEE